MVMDLQSPTTFMPGAIFFHFDFLLSFPHFNNSLLDLVLHYAVNSLEEHNDSLKTCLYFPVGAAPPGQESAAYVPPDNMS